MFLKQRRINKIQKHISILKEGQEIHIALLNTQNFNKELRTIGYSKTLALDEQILPKIVGSISRYNAEGKVKKRKDLPKETVYRQIIWTWEQWCGNGDTETKSKIVDRPYQRYVRENVPPPSEELIITEIDAQKIVISRKITNIPDNYDAIKHLINLFLEIFGECHILDADKVPVIKTTKRLNWEILPKGVLPWKKTIEHGVEKVIKQIKSKNKQLIIRYRFQLVNSFNPDFVVIGRAGFKGYIIYGFESKQLYVLESIFTGNATYIFDKDWEELSKLTKAEILNQNLQYARIIHNNRWKSKIKSLLVKKAIA